MRMRHTDQLAKGGAESRIKGLARHLGEIDSMTREHILRQPARAAAAVLPNVLENIRHLKSLRKGRGDGGQRGAVAGDFRRIVAEKIGEHFAHDAGNVVAIVIQVDRTGEALEAGAELETWHAMAHELDAASNRGPLRLIQTRHD